MMMSPGYVDDRQTCWAREPRWVGNQPGSQVFRLASRAKRLKNQNNDGSRAFAHIYLDAAAGTSNHRVVVWGRCIILEYLSEYRGSRALSYSRIFSRIYIAQAALKTRIQPSNERYSGKLTVSGAPMVKWWRRINRVLTTMSERVEHEADINTTPGHCTATYRSSSTANSAPHSP